MESLTRLDPIALREWMVLLLLACSAMVAYVNWVYPARFKKLFRATFNERITRQLMREEMVFSHRASILLLVVALLMSCLVLSVFLSRYAEPEETFWFLILGLGLGFSLRQLFRSAFALLFVRDVGLREFSFVSALVYKVAGLVILPTTILALTGYGILAHIGLWASMILLGLFAIYRWIRGVSVGHKTGGSWVWAIAYLCTLEILPTLVVLRLVLEHTS